MFPKLLARFIVPSLLGLVSSLGALVLLWTPAFAAANLTISMLTWNVVGLDSNKVADGPNIFPVGVRVCNTGDQPANNLVTALIWDSSNTYINDNGITSLSQPTLAVGACADVYFNIVITRNSAAYNATRRFHITATADGPITVSTPTPREIFVEKLVSQNRNGTRTLTGAANVVVGGTYTYVVNTYTATGGYEQLEDFTLFPNGGFEVLSTSTRHPQPSPATASQLYLDPCVWRNDPAVPATYKSCTNNNNAGGDPIVTTYTVKIKSAGVYTMNTTIYDFSGSSYHYNTDWGQIVKVVTASYGATAVHLTDFSATGSEHSILLMLGIAVSGVLGSARVLSKYRRPRPL